MPSGYVVVYGHGGFTPSSDTPLFTVPDDTQVTFITEPLKTLYMDSEELMTEWTAADLENNAEQWVDADRSCFNYTITPDDDAIPLKGKVKPPDNVRFEIIESEERLESIVRRFAGSTVVVAACRVVDLKNAGGESMGVNSRGMEVDESNLIPSEKLREMRKAGDKNFTPMGVSRCTDTCPDCSGQCRWNDDHVESYNHRCESEHEWADGSDATVAGTGPEHLIETFRSLERDAPGRLVEWYSGLDDNSRKLLLADPEVVEFMQWSPTDAEYDGIKKVADTQLHSLSSAGESTPITVGGVLVLIGDDAEYAAKAIFYRDRQRDKSVGSVTLKKGPFGASYQIKGIPSSQTEIVKQVMKEITDKKLSFV